MSKTMRRLLCYFLAIVMAFCLSSAIVSAVFSVTLADEVYLQRFFTRGAIVDMLAEELDSRYEVLSQETGIDKTVFTDCISRDYIRSVQRTVIEGTRKYSELDFRGVTDIEERLEKAISEYDNQNNIKRTKKELTRLIRSVTDIFNDTCAIKNNEQLAPIANILYSRTVMLTVGFLFIFAVCTFGVLFFSGFSRRGGNYIAMSFATAGMLMSVLSLVIIVTGSVKGLSLTNIEAYNVAIESAVTSVLNIVIIIGFVLMLCAALIFSAIYGYYKKRLLQIDEEDEITRNLI